MHTNIIDLLTASTPHNKRSATLHYLLQSMNVHVNRYLQDFININNMDDYVGLLKKLSHEKESNLQSRNDHNFFIGVLREVSYVYPSHFADRFIDCLERDTYDLFGIFPNEHVYNFLTHNGLSYLLCVDTDVPFDKRLLETSTQYITEHFLSNYMYFPMEQMAINYKRYMQEYVKCTQNFHHEFLWSTLPMIQEIYHDDTWYTCLYEHLLISDIKKNAPFLLSEEQSALADIHLNFRWIDVQPSHDNTIDSEINIFN